jgi:hypothetical protein
MQRIIFSAVVILSVCANAFGQKDAAELARLRLQIGASESTPITRAAQPALPLDRPLKVFITTAGDESASQEVLRSIKKINEKPQKYGWIEVVDSVSKANLILLHYELTEKRRDVADHNMTMDPGLGSRIGSGGKSEYWVSSEFRSYVIARKPEGLEILARYQRQVKLSEPRKELSEALLDLLKRQASASKK